MFSRSFAVTEICTQERRIRRRAIERLPRQSSTLRCHHSTQKRDRERAFRFEMRRSNPQMASTPNIKKSMRSCGGKIIRVQTDFPIHLHPTVQRDGDWRFFVQHPEPTASRRHGEKAQLRLERMLNTRGGRQHTHVQARTWALWRVEIASWYSYASLRLYTLATKRDNDAVEPKTPMIALVRQRVVELCVFG